MMRLTVWAVLFAAGLPAAAFADESGLPLSLQEPEQGWKSAFMDVQNAEVGVWLGAVGASSDYESDPAPGGGLLLRAPSPWLSRDLLGLDTDAFGFFLQLGASYVDRELDPAPPDASGPVVMAALGVDFALARDPQHLLLAQVGVQYLHFSGVFQADDGVGALLGLLGGLNIGEKTWVTLSPQIALGEDGDFLYIVGLGILAGF